MIQLSITPVRGFGILLAGAELAEDFRTGAPYFVRTKRAAKHARVFMAPAWARPQVVAIEKHDPQQIDELPTYVIGKVVT
jgi:hypothetical protein